MSSTEQNYFHDAFVQAFPGVKVETKVVSVLPGQLDVIVFMDAPSAAAIELAQSIEGEFDELGRTVKVVVRRRG